MEALRENRADRVQDVLDFLQSAIALDVTFSGLNNKLADGAVLTRLELLHGSGGRAHANLSAEDGRGLLLEDELNQGLTLLGNEVVALIKNI